MIQSSTDIDLSFRAHTRSEQLFVGGRPVKVKDDLLCWDRKSHPGCMFCASDLGARILRI